MKHKYPESHYLPNIILVYQNKEKARRQKFIEENKESEYKETRTLSRSEYEDKAFGGKHTLKTLLSFLTWNEWIRKAGLVPNKEYFSVDDIVWDVWRVNNQALEKPIDSTYYSEHGSHNRSTILRRVGHWPVVKKAVAKFDKKMKIIFSLLDSISKSKQEANEVLDFVETMTEIISPIEKIVQIAQLIEEEIKEVIVPIEIEKETETEKEEVIIPVVKVPIKRKTVKSKTVLKAKTKRIKQKKVFDPEINDWVDPSKKIALQSAKNAEAKIIIVGEDFEGLRRAYIEEDGVKKYFHVDKKEQPVYRQMYMWVGDFYNCKASVKTFDNNLFQIDSAGQRVKTGTGRTTSSYINEAK